MFFGIYIPIRRLFSRNVKGYKETGSGIPGPGLIIQMSIFKTFRNANTSLNQSKITESGYLKP